MAGYGSHPRRLSVSQQCTLYTAGLERPQGLCFKWVQSGKCTAGCAERQHPAQFKDPLKQAGAAGGKGRAGKRPGSRGGGNPNKGAKVADTAKE